MCIIKIMKQRQPRVIARFGDGLVSQMAASHESIERSREVLLSPVFRASEVNASYRFLNYLETTGLLKNRRPDSTKGWRRLNWLEHVYVLIVVELRKYGVRTEVIKPFADLFLDEGRNDALMSMMAVLGGVEITIIFKPDGSCAILDPLHLGLYESGSAEELVLPKGSGEIQLKLSSFVNQLWQNVGLDPVEVRQFFGKAQYDGTIKGTLTEAEKEAIISMRRLSSTDTLTVRRLNNKTEMLLDVDQSLPVDTELARRIDALVEGNFANMRVIKREGKVVSIKKSKNVKVSD